MGINTINLGGLLKYDITCSCGWSKDPQLKLWDQLVLGGVNARQDRTKQCTVIIPVFALGQTSEQKPCSSSSSRNSRHSSSSSSSRSCNSRSSNSRILPRILLLTMNISPAASIAALLLSSRYSALHRGAEQLSRSLLAAALCKEIGKTEKAG